MCSRSTSSSGRARPRRRAPAPRLGGSHRTRLDEARGPAIELGDFERGYRAIDISGNDQRLYSLTCPLYLA